MSQENVEVAHRLVDAVARRDISLLIELTDPEIEWHVFFAELGQGGFYRGHAGLQQYFNDLNEAFAVLHAHVDDDLAVDDVVILVGRLITRGRVSGVEVAVPTGWVLKYRGGRVLRMRAFRQPAEALEAVGLRE